MFRSLRVLLVSAVFVVAAFSAVGALAAPAAWQRVDVTLHPEQASSILLVYGELPAATPLPAEAELAVPAGSQVQWIGEILGGPPANDPTLTYTKTTAKGLDLYAVTLTKTRNAQIEIPVVGQSFDGSAYSSAISWTAPAAVPEVRLMVRVPQGAQLVTSTAGAELVPGDTGYAYYTKTVTGVKAGDTLDLAVGYTAPAAAAPTAGTAVPASGSSSVVPVLLIVFGVLGAAFAILAIRRKMTRTAADATDADADEVEAAHDAFVAEPVPSSPKPAPKRSSVAAAKGGSRDAAPMTGKSKRTIVTAAIIGGLVIVAVVVAIQTTKPQAIGDTISQTFAQGEACATATIALNVPSGADPKATAETLFAALRPTGVINTATYNVKTSSIELGFCESNASEAVFRQALAPTGLVAQGAAPATVPTAPAE